MAEAAQAENLSGQRLGHYVLLEEIGAGAMGRVYRARDERLERDVAIKILPPRSLTDPEARKRFRKEALALSKLNHPNIATIHDFDTAGELDFLVMEHIAGASLDEKLVHGPLTEKEAARLGQQLAEGLAAAHTAGVLHRDLKPANVRVTDEGRLKVLDFGLAKLALPASATTSTESGSQQFVGTFPYMAPEQLLGEKLDSRTDIYAAGNVLYEMATGQRPFADEQGSRLVEGILHEAPQPPRGLNGKTSAAFENVILKCLEKEPENRYQSANELVVDLRRIGAGSVATKNVPTLRKEREGWGTPGFRWGSSALRFSLLAVAVAVALVLVLKFATPGKKGQEWGTPKTSSAQVKIESLAVLPLQNISSDAGQEYFADGMTDELISRLARAVNLRVISRTSVMQYKNAQKALPEIARELGVDAVVEGSVMRAGDRVRITAQLIDARRDQHLWGDSYNRDLRDVLALQDEVAEAISNHIGSVLAGTAPQPARKIDPQAYDAYLHGLYYWNKRTSDDVKKALGYFQDAIKREPGYAAAYAGVADCYLELQWGSGMPSSTALAQARAAANQALELDPNLPEAHATNGELLLTADWNWSGAEAEFRKAIELNPSYAMAHHRYGLELGQLGRVEEAKRELELARELDPAPAINRANVAWAYYVGRDYSAAIKILEQVLQQDPDFWVARWGLGSSYVQMKKYPEALAELERAVTLSQRDPGTVSSLAVAEARAGKVAEARKLLAELLEAARRQAASGTDIAVVYAALGQREQAFAWLEKAYAAHAHDLLSLDADPWWESLRADKRFKELRRKVGLAIFQDAGQQGHRTSEQ